MIPFTMMPGHHPEELGLIPGFLFELDSAPATVQFNFAYGHGGGWRPFSGFTRTKRGLEYPGDPPMKLITIGKLHDETIEIYDSAWVCIVQVDGSYEISRMD